MGSWLLSCHIWEKRGPSELCSLSCEYKQQLSTLSALISLMKFQVQVWSLLQCRQTYHQHSLFPPTTILLHLIYLGSTQFGAGSQNMLHHYQHCRTFKCYCDTSNSNAKSKVSERINLERLP